MGAVAYYNEHEPYAAQWLRNLINAGIIAPGDVDTRSITDVRADDLRGYTQAHFFAGIGGWSIALRGAGWPDNRPVWTGSCPCQPFSAAGSGKADADPRHLWPAWFPLIAERRPTVVFGEQVEAAVGWGWLDSVFGDLEKAGYACGATVLPACSVGAPHKRDRLWFVADTDGGNASAERLQRSGQHRLEQADSRTGDVGDAASIGIGAGLRGRGPGELGRLEPSDAGRDGNATGQVADAESRGFGERRGPSQSRDRGHDDGRSAEGGMGEPGRAGLQGQPGDDAREAGRSTEARPFAAAGDADALAYAERHGGGADIEERRPEGRTAHGWHRQGPRGNGFWDNAIWNPMQRREVPAN